MSRNGSTISFGKRAWKCNKKNCDKTNNAQKMSCHGCGSKPNRQCSLHGGGHWIPWDEWQASNGNTSQNHDKTKVQAPTRRTPEAEAAIEKRKRLAAEAELKKLKDQQTASVKAGKDTSPTFTGDMSDAADDGGEDPKAVPDKSPEELSSRLSTLQSDIQRWERWGREDASMVEVLQPRIDNAKSESTHIRSRLFEQKTPDEQLQQATTARDRIRKELEKSNAKVQELDKEMRALEERLEVAAKRVLKDTERLATANARVDQAVVQKHAAATSPTSTSPAPTPKPPLESAQELLQSWGSTLMSDPAVSPHVPGEMRAMYNEGMDALQKIIQNMAIMQGTVQHSMHQAQLLAQTQQQQLQQQQQQQQQQQAQQALHANTQLAPAALQQQPQQAQSAQQQQATLLQQQQQQQQAMIQQQQQHLQMQTLAVQHQQQMEEVRRKLDPDDSPLVQLQEIQQEERQQLEERQNRQKDCPGLLEMSPEDITALHEQEWQQLCTLHKQQQQQLHSQQPHQQPQLQQPAAVQQQSPPTDSFTLAVAEVAAKADPIAQKIGMQAMSAVADAKGTCLVADADKPEAIKFGERASYDPTAAPTAAPQPPSAHEYGPEWVAARRQQHLTNGDGGGPHNPGYVLPDGCFHPFPHTHAGMVGPTLDAAVALKQQATAAWDDYQQQRGTKHNDTEHANISSISTISTVSSTSSQGGGQASTATKPIAEPTAAEIIQNRFGNRLKHSASVLETTAASDEAMQ